jgi:hypothetical protein
VIREKSQILREGTPRYPGAFYRLATPEVFAGGAFVSTFTVVPTMQERHLTNSFSHKFKIEHAVPATEGAVSDRRSTAPPRIDFLLLPLIGIFTVTVMIGSSEIVSRSAFPGFAENEIDTCALSKTSGGHHKPNCSVTLKVSEGPPYAENYNGCGYRSIAPCGPKSPGHTRIALIGSSFSLGWGVPYEQSFAGETERDLTLACHRPVEIQNLSAAGLQPLQIEARVGEALALRPDLLIIVIDPQDAHVDYTSAEMQSRDRPVALEQRAHYFSPLRNLARTLKSRLYSITVAEHYLYYDQDAYDRHYLQYGDEADFLRKPLSDRWAKRYSNLDVLIGEMADQAKQAGVQMVLAPGLQRAQVGLMHDRSLPPGVDPFEFDRRLATIAARHSIATISSDDEFARIGNPSNLFYAIDGHLNAEGNDVYHRALTRGLLSGGFEAFKGCPVYRLLSN